MSIPPITHEMHGSKGAFVVERDGQRLATMTYTLAGALVIIDHTEVADVLRGTGAGRALVEAAVEWARAEHRRILPLCPFARSVFERTPAFRDVLSE